MWESIANLFKQGGSLYTGSGESPGVEKRLDAGLGDPALSEKGSILGMTPSTFASVAGQLGSAISPKDSWQSKLGSVAAQMGSQKLSQLMQAEKERRATDLWKQILKQTSNKQLAGMGAGLPETGIPKSPESQMSLGMYGQDLTGSKNQI
jgi:hypothetical protein